MAKSLSLSKRHRSLDSLDAFCQRQIRRIQATARPTHAATVDEAQAYPLASAEIDSAYRASHSDFQTSLRARPRHVSKRYLDCD